MEGLQKQGSINCAKIDMIIATEQNAADSSKLDRAKKGLTQNRRMKEATMMVMTIT
jgi:hypothetical protein